MNNNLLQPGDIINRFVLDKSVGVGAYGSVWKAIDYTTKLEVAIKMVSIASIEDPKDQRSLLNALSIIGTRTSKWRHRNIVPHLYGGLYQQWYYIVMPFYKYGSITYYLRKTQIKETQCWLLLHDISAGLSHLNQNSLFHQNITPENVLIDDDGRFVLSGYGVERYITNYLRNFTKFRLINSFDNNPYSAPEICHLDSHDRTASDIWAIGAVLYELLSGGSPPFEGNGGVAQLGGEKLLAIEGDYSDKLKRLVYKCLSLHPEDRPSLYELASTCCQKVSMSL